MARLPDSLGTKLPTPEAPTSVASSRSVRIDDGAGLVQMGSALSNAANDLQTVILEEQKRINTAKVEDAFNQLRNSQNELTFGEQDGFMNIKGGDAVKRPLLKDYSEQFNSAASALAEGLDNDEQREMFKKRAAVSQAQFTQDILQHLYRENDIWQKQVTTATLDIELRTASAKWNSPDEVGASLARINAAVDNEADRMGLPPEMREDLKLKEAAKVHAAVIGQALAEKRYDYAKSWFDTYRNEIDTQTAKVLERSVEDASQKQLFNDYQSEFLSSRDSTRSLAALETKVLKDQTLDENRKNILIGRIQSRGEILENRAERYRAQAERALERQISAVNNLTLQGFEPTTEQMAPLVTAAKGTSMEPMVQQMIATANATRQFRNLPFREQEATITQMEAAARKDPTKFDVTMVARFKTIHDNQKREVREDPVTFAARQGLVAADDPAAAPINLSKPDPAQLSARFDLARSMASKYQSRVKPLTTDEVEALRGALKNANPAQKREYFAALATAAGNDIGGYKAIMGQIAPDDPVTAIAGINAAQKTPARQATADLILRGQAILHPSRKEDGSPDKGKLWPMPQGKDESTMRMLFVDQVGDAYAGMPKAQTDMYQAAQAIYAAKVSDAGNASGILDTDAWKEAIKLATGGVAKYEGKSTVLPWGMSFGDFKNELRTRADFLAASGQLLGVTADKLKDLPVQAVGDGKYVFRAGDGVLVDKDNRPVVVDFNSPLPAPIPSKPTKTSFGPKNTFLTEDRVKKARQAYEAAAGGQR